MLKITQVKSAIRRKQDHKDTLRALGLKRLHHTVYQEDTESVRGMVRKIGYMLEVSEVDAPEAPADGGAKAQAAPAPASQPSEPEQVTDVADEPEADELPDEDMFPDQADDAATPGDAPAEESGAGEPEADATEAEAEEEPAAEEKTEE